MKRWGFGFLAAILLSGILYIAPTSVILGLVTLLSIMAFVEYAQLTLPHISLFHKIVGALFSGGLCGFLLFGTNQGEFLIFILAGLFCLTCFLFFRGQTVYEERFRDLSVFFLGIIYCGFLFSFIGLVRTLSHWPFWLLTLLAATFLADTGAYVFGHWLGKNKLAPTLSPGKTIEGFFGGWLFALLAITLVRSLFWPEAPLIKSLILASIMACIGPIGDLSESLIKRAMNVKDSGRFLPGHGGLLDRLDALLFTAPCVYFFAKYIF
ncbi:MAG: hypothetical protein ACD_73C00189G0006 [uncultured bacterium]|nr:MAG: hypothetical protein ACD_73C00189G0006 [uncultured bacterium]